MLYTGLRNFFLYNYRKLGRYLKVSPRGLRKKSSTLEQVAMIILSFREYGKGGGGGALPQRFIKIERDELFTLVRPTSVKPTLLSLFFFGC